MGLTARIIPVLLLHEGGLIKTKKFEKPIYVGDPINAVRIFNEKEVDELIILDIDCTKEKKEPNYSLIAEIVSEAFMPIAYGGGITNIEIAKKIFQLGVEKVIINSVLNKNLQIISQIASIYGVQSVVASVDYRRNFFGKIRVCFNNGNQISKWSPLEFSNIVENAGAGEIMLNSIDREGTYEGYDIKLLSEVSNKVRIPVIVSGGVYGIKNMILASRNGASGMAAGSLFIYQRPHNAVLISYLNSDELIEFRETLKVI